MNATIEREIISTQNICFFDVANDEINEIIKNEIFETISDEITNDVNINVDSLDEKNVANDVNIVCDINIAIVVILTNFAFDVSIDATNDCFDVKKNVNIAIIAIIAIIVVNISILFDVIIAI